jgi:serine/threonine-protein kinase
VVEQLGEGVAVAVEYRIDLTDYDWDQETWAQITARDPYAVVFESEAARVIQDLADVDLFSVRADWFLEAASQPPLYHEVLDIPEDRAALEARLGVDVAGNILDELARDDDDVVRAGFQDSKVSDFNRAIERHQHPASPERGYWLSYDFGSNDAQKSLLADPLDFVADGGEIIFTLPNGLQGYMLVDGDGKRIDTGPPNIVHDGETIEEPIVINGLSCMSCHSEGMRKATDAVGPFAAGNSRFDAVEREQIARLYAPADVFAAALDRDIATFAAAMSLTGAPLRVGDHEPVMAAHLAFEQPVDLRRAAAEFGVDERELLKNIGQLRELDILDRAPVDRDVFEANFADNACRLNLGRTAACPPEPVAE